MAQMNTGKKKLKDGLSLWGLAGSPPDNTGTTPFDVLAVFILIICV
jgi:hypothetical protein